MKLVWVELLGREVVMLLIINHARFFLPWGLLRKIAPGILTGLQKMGQNKRERFSRVTLTSDKHYSAYQLKKKKLQGIYIGGYNAPSRKFGNSFKTTRERKRKEKMCTLDRI